MKELQTNRISQWERRNTLDFASEMSETCKSNEHRPLRLVLQLIYNIILDTNDILIQSPLWERSIWRLEISMSWEADEIAIYCRKTKANIFDAP